MFPQANRRIGRMRDTLDKPDDPENKKRIETAFGPNYKLDEIKTVVGNLEHGFMPVRTANPDVADGESKGRPSNAKVSYNRDPITKSIDTTGHPMKHTLIGSRFHNKMSPAEQAGTLIHEATHYQSLTGDDVGPGGVIIPSAGKLPGEYASRGGCE